MDELDLTRPCVVVQTGVTVVTTPLRPDGSIGWRVSFAPVLCLTCQDSAVLTTLTMWVNVGEHVVESSLAVPYVLFESMKEGEKHG